MAGSVNKVFLIGNLGKNPEVRTTQAGAKIVTLTLATGESWTDKATGERRERTEWHRIVVFNERLADVAERFLRKGRSCASRARCRRASGPTRRAWSAPAPRWCCSSSAAS